MIYMHGYDLDESIVHDNALDEDRTVDLQCLAQGPVPDSDQPGQ
jgi:hypothetical protein